MYLVKNVSNFKSVANIIFRKGIYLGTFFSDTEYIEEHKMEEFDRVEFRSSSTIDKSGAEKYTIYVEV